MEIMTASNYASMEPRPTTTRVNEQQQQPSLSQPASQESFVSVRSAASGISKLHGSESNLSQATTHTDLTSPTSSSRDRDRDGAIHATRDLHVPRDSTPEEVNSAHTNGSSALASPMSIASPVVTGTKRSLNGHVKNAPSLGSNNPYDQRSRRESTASSGSRAGELAASLKERLGYAFLKVQHGWEHKSLNEVEHLAARARNNRASMSHVEQRPDTSRLSNGAANLSMYDRIYNTGGQAQDASAPPSKRHSGTYHMQHVQPQQYYQPSLQPAPDIRPTSSQRSYQFPSSQPATYSNTAMSPPRTPSNDHPRRPPTIRTETQTKEAEQEALQALWQLGSPHTSQAPPHSSTSSQQASPLKTHMDLSATPRRVTFARSESNSSNASSGYIQESRARALDDLENR